MSDEIKNNIIQMDQKMSNITRRKLNVQCKGVYKIFKQGNLEVIALKDVNLSIYAGELVVIMGPSGSGKTTLLNVISGMEEPSAGSIRIKNIDVTKLRDKGLQIFLQNEIGFVFQFFNLIPSLTARGNIRLPMIIAKKDAKERESRVNDLLKTVDLTDRANHRPHTLSGGERQRVAIAMAFANNPDIILADEPTGNIDSISAEKVMAIFKKFLDNNPQKSIIIVTHDPKFRKLADRTLIIRDGQIIRELGKVEENSKQNNSYENQDGISKVYEMNFIQDEAQQILNPAIRKIEFKEIKNCPNCHSTDIIKKYNQDSGNYQIFNNQLITEVVVYCHKCNQISFVTAGLYDIQKDLIN